MYFSTLSEPLEKIVRFGQTLDFFEPSAIGTSVFYEDLGKTVSAGGLAGVVDQVTGPRAVSGTGLTSPPGRTDELRAEVDAGTDAAAERFITMLEERGETAMADRIGRLGLNPDGSMAHEDSGDQ